MYIGKRKSLLFTLSMFLLPIIYGQTSTLVSMGTNGKLVYTSDSKGNTVPDFSGVGYMNSTVPIPTIPVVLTVNPVVGDNLANVQNAINTVAAMPLGANGFRGAILFKIGTYRISDELKITASGIVLRGEGFAGNGTNFIATKTAQHSLFNFIGPSGPNDVSSTTREIKDNYLPFGTKQVTVAPGHNFSVGDSVLIHRIPNSAWIRLLEMDSLTLLDPTSVNWTADAYDMNSERLVTGVNGNVITIDAPIMDIIDTAYAKGEMVKYSANRIEKCGIENMRISSTYTSSTDENHGWEAVTFFNVINSWAKNLEVYYFGYSAVHILDGSTWITVDSCKMYDAKSLIDGGRRYSFNVDGQRCLVQNCITRNGRHDYVNGSRTCGPVVFYNCTSTLQKSDIGPHHRWSTGILFDNIVGDGSQNIQNRLASGSGHGWAGAQVMYWNCTAAKMVIQDPQGDAVNWSIGAVCPDITGVGDMTTEPLGIVESQGTRIAAIPSLFMAQLNDRLNTLSGDAIKFEVKAIEHSAFLKWSLKGPSRKYIFYIEHSIDGKDFHLLGEISSWITSLNSYTFKHNTPSIGGNFYRIKQVDVNGKLVYSSVRYLAFGKRNLTIKTNLVHNMINVKFNGQKNDTFFIFNGNGQKVLSGKTIGQSTIDVSSLPAGLYFIQTESGALGRFVKQ